MYKILLLEDAPAASSIINNLLSEFCQLHITSSASIALHLSSLNNYNLIMIDINLHPEGTGINTANTIKNMTSYNSFPIVGYTLLKLAGNREYLLSRGYTHLIEEPFNARNFAQHIKFILSSHLDTNRHEFIPVGKTPVPKMIFYNGK